MESMKPKSSISDILLKIGAALAGGILLFVLVIGLATTSFRAVYSGRIFPNIQIGWINLSGQDPIDAADLLRGEIQYPEQGEITLQYDDLSWTATPGELGMFFSPQFNAELAFNAGREGNIARRIAAQIQILRHGMILAPQFVMDEKTGSEYLAGLAAEVNQPVMEASLELKGLEVVVQPGQIGREMDIQASLEVVGLQMQSMQNGSIPLIVSETYPAILDVTAQAEFARQILSEPLLLQIPNAAENDPGPWSIQPDKLVQMMIIERVNTEDGEEYRIALDSEALREYLVGREGKINREPKNARMYFDDETKELVLIEEDETGLVLNIDQSIIDIQAQLLEGTHQIDLAVEKTFPAVTSEHTAEDLGITELVSSQTSYFYGSDSSRMNNI
ncbi:MAG: peptidoglycan binding domain-containing protein, partial [Anaerolineales bacterium]|nr:peptidoglycan binding domain-containing protein [Anaerolineales bacterium]